MRKAVHFRTGGFLNMAAAQKGETWPSPATYCGMKMVRPPNLYEVAEVGSPKATCKKCLAKLKAVHG